jgi:hypothetical protein
MQLRPSSHLQLVRSCLPAPVSDGGARSTRLSLVSGLSGYVDEPDPVLVRQLASHQHSAPRYALPIVVSRVACGHERDVDYL